MLSFRPYLSSVATFYYLRRFIQIIPNSIQYVVMSFPIYSSGNLKAIKTTDKDAHKKTHIDLVIEYSSSYTSSLIIVARLSFLFISFPVGRHESAIL